MSLVDLFWHYWQENKKPALLQFQHPNKKTTRLDILGIDPYIKLVVKQNVLYLNDAPYGHALDLFSFLRQPKSTKFFPCFIGFISYEFARYFSYDVNVPSSSMPDACFFGYKEGILAENDCIKEGNYLFPNDVNIVSEQFLAQELEPTITKKKFCEKIRLIKKAIKNGEVYQVNFSTPLHLHLNNHQIPSLYKAMNRHNKSPYMGIFTDEDWWILSQSPERLFYKKGSKVNVRPIAGTKKRGECIAQDNKFVNELLTCEKEQAEHSMLVDLMRNDLNKIADIKSCQVIEHKTVEFYSHVMHLVSELQANTSAHLKEVFQALFPGGTITGAPKANVMKLIAMLEDTPRGPYTGSLGYVSGGYGVDFNILIRSIIKDKDKTVINAGAGIVIDSKEEQEWHEIKNKAKAISDILQYSLKDDIKPSRNPLRGPFVTKNIDCQGFQQKNVLFFENKDSFSYNIIAALKLLGANVEVCKNYKSNILDYTHLVIGPGPGYPKDYSNFKNIINTATTARIPLLGICLGHQAIAEYFGATIIKTKLPIHGKTTAIHHKSQGLFKNMEPVSKFARYHSLAIDRAPSGFFVDAYSNDDYVMAIRHSSLPIFGIQFHPESYLSQSGDILLKNFLSNK